MDYNNFIKSIENNRMGLELCEEYFSYFMRNPELCKDHLDLIREGKGDKALEKRIDVIKNLIVELNLQLFIMKHDLNTTRKEIIPTTQLLPIIKTKKIQWKDLKNAKYTY